MILQEDGKLTSRYCNHRWCYVCNAIRTAKLIDGYEPVLMNLPELRFVTLTRPNVQAHELPAEISDMTKTFRAIRDRLRKQKIKLAGVRKLEITYNEKRNDYHPHFHMIITGELEAQILVQEWLLSNPKASEQAQDNRPADQESLRELFKYCSKIKDNTPVANDTIFKSVYGKRMIQPFGGIRRVSEDVEDLVADIIFDGTGTDSWLWHDDAQDWVSTTDGAMLSEYVSALETRAP